MRKLGILGVASLGLLVMAQYAMSGRGGAVRGGMRGAVVGEMVGGSEGASKGAKIGVVTGATRNAIDLETKTRNAYYATAEYQNAQHSNYNEAPPDVLGSTASSKATTPAGEAVIRKNGKPLVGITYPADWQQKIGDAYISAVSKDGQAYAMISTLDAPDKKAAIKGIQAGFGRYLKDMKFDDPTETKRGALLITGTGKGKEKGVDVVFAAATFEAAKGQLVGVAFIVDAKMDDHYKETIKGTCQTIRRAADFATDKD